MKIKLFDKPYKIPEEQEIFEFPRCPKEKNWFGYLRYSNGEIEYQGKLYEHKEAEEKVKEDIENRIKNVVGDFLGHIEVYTYIDANDSTMFLYNCYSKDGTPIREGLTSKKLEILYSNVWVTLDEARKQKDKDEDNEKQPIEDKWMRVRTRIGRDKLLLLIADILDGKDKYNKDIRDLKINFKEDGTYAVHKQLKE